MSDADDIELQNETQTYNQETTSPESKFSRKKTIYNGFIRAVNNAVKPVERATDTVRKVVDQSRKHIPFIYDHINQLLNQHLVSKNDLIDKPKLKSISNLLTARLAAMFPHANQDQVEAIIQAKDKGSFMSMLSQGFADPTSKDYTIISDKQLFKRVLIANRGEIALRIMRACRELDIEVVALYSKGEEQSLLVKLADHTKHIGDPQEYLNIAKIVSIAREFKVDAIHPGYGFLSENAEFARLCEQHNIEFIGPTSDMIQALGNKVFAKNSMKQSGVPVIEGSSALNSYQEAHDTASHIGYPVILKASSGGGGKGMRIVRNQNELESAFSAAKEEAARAFADDSVYLEKYVEDPKHIEFQILADKYGNVIHLGERDCSIQRKHQKLIEEAPSPALTSALREKVGSAAVEAVKSIQYEGAGTVEFLFDKNGNYFFIEMNTRIQVEHGVTEMITGVDLVKEQIKLAAGARLSHAQKDITFDGWAIECRINAEDPYNDFLPSTGKIGHYLPPIGPGIRLSSPCHQGYNVQSNFDSLLALMICHGKNRQEAISRMNLALSEYVISGVKTTIPFHTYVLNHNAFVNGSITTSFIEKQHILHDLHAQQKNNKETTQITDDVKKLIVTTAVSKYMHKKNASLNNKQRNDHTKDWISLSREESLAQGNFSSES